MLAKNSSISIILCNEQGHVLYLSDKNIDHLHLLLKLIEDNILKYSETDSKSIVLRFGEHTLEIKRLDLEKCSIFLCLLHKKTDLDTHWHLVNLIHENNELTTIFETSRDGIVVADKGGVYTRINKSYERISGISISEIIGKKAEEIVAEGLISQSATAMVLKSGVPQSLTQEFSTGRVSEVTANPLFDDKGNIYRVVTNVRDTTELAHLRDELASSQEQLDRYSRLVENLMPRNDMIFKSMHMRDLCNNASKFAKVDAHVLIEGETGTGKELVADFIHKNSNRAQHAFLKINCGAIPETLLESELFGYEKGAFTGADVKGRPGLLELANKGTVFLDEISEVSLKIQIKLLRFIQNKEYFRIGGSQMQTLDVRIVAATNRNLEQMMEQGLLRSDLFYRLNVLKLNVPPLRERSEDIFLLVNHFIHKFNQKYRRNASLSPAVYKNLFDYKWPGNVRELENLIERLVVMSSNVPLDLECLPENIRLAESESGQDPSNYAQAKQVFEQKFWQQALKQYKTYRATAKAMGVDHTTVLNKIKKYKLEGN